MDAIESNCYLDDPTPTIVSTIYTLAALIAALCVSIAGGIVGFKKAKLKKLAKLTQEFEQEKCQQQHHHNKDADKFDEKKSTMLAFSNDSLRVHTRSASVSTIAATSNTNGNMTGFDNGEEKSFEFENTRINMITTDDNDNQTRTNSKNDKMTSHEYKQKDLENWNKIKTTGPSEISTSLDIVVTSDRTKRTQLKSTTLTTIMDGKKAPHDNETAPMSVAKALESDELTFNICDKKLIWYFLKFSSKEAWNKKRCYVPFVTHIIDQATDIAVILRFYQIYKFENENNYDCPKINGGYLFWLSVAAFCTYRIISCIWIYNITNGRKIDTLSQLFDLKLYHALYINFVLNKQVPSNPQRYLQILEAALESFPQCVIQLYYLVKVGFDNYDGDSANGIIIVSLIFSIFNISSKMVSEDKVFFDKKYHSLNFILGCRAKNQISCVNLLYVFRLCLRLFDLVHRLLLILLTWLILGGPIVFIYLSFEFICLLMIAALLKQLSVLVWIAQTPFQIPVFWTNRRVLFENINIKDWIEVHWSKIKVWQVCIACCCCAGYCGDDMNFALWMAMMYRFIITLSFCSIIVHKTSLNDENDQLHTWSIMLLLLTLITTWLLSFRFGLTKDESGDFDHKDQKPKVTLDRSAANLASSDALNEIADLQMFGMDIDQILPDDTVIKMAAFVAAENGDVDALEILVNVGADFNMKTDKGYTPMAIAGINQQIDCMEFLKDKTKNFDINTVYKYTYPSTLLILGAKKHNFKFITYLLDTFSDTIDITVGDWEGWTAVSHFMHTDNIKGIELILYHPKMNKELVDCEETKVVIYAAKHDKVDMLKTLRNHGARFDGFNYKGNTPLITAIENGQLEAVRFLLSQGKTPPDPLCDINQPNNETGKTPLMTAVTTLIFEKNCKQITKMLIEQFNADVNLTDQDGNSALHHAIGGHGVKMLKKCNIDINLVNNKGMSALHLAVRSFHGDFDAVQDLIDRGIDINIINEDGYTALMVACMENTLKSMKVLIENSKDFNVNEKNEHGETLLILGIKSRKKCESTVKYLLNTFEETIDVNIKDKNGYTALMYAAQSANKYDVLNYLISNYKDKIDFNASNNCGDSALDFAKKNKLEKSAQLLQSNGARDE